MAASEPVSPRAIALRPATIEDHAAIRWWIQESENWHQMVDYMRGGPVPTVFDRKDCERMLVPPADTMIIQYHTYESDYGVMAAGWRMSDVRMLVTSTEHGSRTHYG
jgi:hypothetical protein